ncbi:MAG: SoxR reducing system RseC family protein [Magnetococcales bacterium]|nr:SoxR reducing system RseC family protein [Magnetococcales bacterium]
MMREEGRVISLEGSVAIVTSERKKSCGSCASKGSCSTLTLSSGHEETRIRANNQAGAKVGDRVVVEIQERQFLRASFMVYIVPLLVMILVGAAVRSLLLDHGLVRAAEGFGALAGFVGLGVAFFLLRGFNTRIENSARFLPVISDVVSVGTHASVRHSLD